MLRKAVIAPLVIALLCAGGAALMWTRDDRLAALVLGITSGWLVCIGASMLQRWGGLVVSGITALMVSLYLGVLHKGLAGESICSVDATFDCDRVNSSAYAELFDVPIAFLGSGFYAGVVMVAICAIRGRPGYDRAAHLVALGGWISVIYSAFLALASAGLGAWCLFCISLYGLNVIILWAASGLVRASDAGLLAGVSAAFKGKGERSLNGLAGAGVVMLIGTMAWYSTGADSVPEGDDAESLSTMFHATEGPLLLDGTEPSLGPVSATYTVVEFADYECPFCGQVFPAVHALADENPDTRVLFKHYPISGDCNDDISGVRHENSCGAAKAADCANQQGKFWDLSRLMFKNQLHLDREGISIMAQQVGLDVAALLECMDQPSAEAAVRIDVAHAGTVGVHATPSIFLKGLYGDVWVQVSQGPEAVGKLLAAHRAGKAFPDQPPPPEEHAH